MNPIKRSVLIEDIYEKFKNNIELTDDELYVVYGLEEGPSYEDSRLDEIIASRGSIREELAKLLNASEDEITMGLYDEIPNESTRYHFGDLVLRTETIDDFKFPYYIYGNCIIDEVAAINKFTDGPNGEKIPAKVRFPFYIKKDFIMGSLTEAHRVVLPDVVGGNVDLRSLKEIDLPIKCMIYGDAKLSSMENKEVIDSFNCFGDIEYNKNSTKQSVKKI